MSKFIGFIIHDWRRFILLARFSTGKRRRRQKRDCMHVPNLAVCSQRPQPIDM